MEFKNIEALEHLAAGPLTFTHRGERFTLPHPAQMTVEDIFVAVQGRFLREMPRSLTPRQTDLLFERWAARHDLPDLRSLQRLFYAMDKHRRAAEFDLRRLLGEDLTALWKARRWGYLLSLIDHLPRDSWYTEATSNDEDYAAAVAKASADAQTDGKTYHPPLRVWTEEVSMLAQVLDAVRNLNSTLVSVNGGKPGNVQPTPRPETAMETAQRQAVQERKKARHDSLVARMLPHKAKKG